MVGSIKNQLRHAKPKQRSTSTCREMIGKPLHPLPTNYEGSCHKNRKKKRSWLCESVRNCEPTFVRCFAEANIVLVLMLLQADFRDIIPNLSINPLFAFGCILYTTVKVYWQGKFRTVLLPGIAKTKPIIGLLNLTIRTWRKKISKKLLSTPPGREIMSMTQ